ncbi:MAG: hypothetical protein K5860_05410 [Bacteroidales bacterium]|nr:hypothetical protein [Bacteroidales bacterium]
MIVIKSIIYLHYALEQLQHAQLRFIIIVRLPNIVQGTFEEPCDRFGGMTVRSEE